MSDLLRCPRDIYESIYIEREIWCHRVHFCQLRFIVIFCLSLHLSLIKSCAASGSRNNNYIHIREDAHTLTTRMTGSFRHSNHTDTFMHAPIRPSTHPRVWKKWKYLFSSCLCQGCDLVHISLLGLRLWENGNECVLAWATGSFWKDEWVQYIL